MKVAFIGLGNMGCPMALNLAKSNFKVTAFDASESMRANSAAEGLVVAESAKRSAEGVDAIVTMLPNGRIVSEVWQELVSVLPAGTLMIDCSTIDVLSAKSIHHLARASGHLSLDAPVSGGVGGAKAANLTFMCGGTDRVFELAKPILNAMGKRVVHCGEAGTGQAAKICNNMVLGVSMIAVCEAFNLADKLGLDRQALFDVVSTSSGSCWSINTYCPVPAVGPQTPADNHYAPGFAAALMLKDLTLSQQAASESGANTPLGGHAAKLYESYVTQGNGGKDFSGIIEALANGLGKKA